MKKVITALLITVFATTLHYASAQINTTTHDTVVGKHPRCFVLSEYHTAHPIAVKGLAAMVARPEEMAIASGAWSLTDQNLPQYLMLYQRTDTAIVLLNTPLRWDTLSPTLQVLPDITNEGPTPSHTATSTWSISNPPSMSTPPSWLAVPTMATTTSLSLNGTTIIRTTGKYGTPK